MYVDGRAIALIFTASNEQTHLIKKVNKIRNKLAIDIQVQVDLEPPSLWLVRTFLALCNDIKLVFARLMYQIVESTSRPSRERR